MSQPPEVYAILERDGPYYLDPEYVKAGTEEGWLVFDDRYTFNEIGQLVWIYRLRSPP